MESYKGNHSKDSNMNKSKQVIKGGKKNGTFIYIWKTLEKYYLTME